MSVSNTMRYDVLWRDNFTCRYCGRKAPDVVLHVDHVAPRSLGGPNTLDNLVTACVDCNAGKRDRDDVAVCDCGKPVALANRERYPQRRKVRRRYDPDSTLRSVVERLETLSPWQLKAANEHLSLTESVRLMGVGNLDIVCRSPERPNWNHAWEKRTRLVVLRAGRPIRKAFPRKTGDPRVSPEMLVAAMRAYGPRL